MPYMPLIRHPFMIAMELGGQWGYQIDTGLEGDGIVYGPGRWPFYRNGRPAAVRLSPDVAYSAWHVHYVLASPAGFDQVQLLMHCHDDTIGSRMASVYAHLDLARRRVVVAEALTDHLRWQAAGKARRVLDYVDAAYADRLVHNRPVTAEMRAAATATRTYT